MFVPPTAFVRRPIGAPVCSEMPNERQAGGLNFLRRILGCGLQPEHIDGLGEAVDNLQFRAL